MGLQGGQAPLIWIRKASHPWTSDDRKDPQEWEAWKAVEAKPKGEAMSEFCAKVKALAAAEAAAKAAGGISL